MKFTGSCHCQQIQFECEFELKQPTVCDCSYCSKRNAILHIVDDVTILKGSKQLSRYRFNKMEGAHYFCKTCSIFIYSVPPKAIYPFAVSLCVLDDGDWRAFDLLHFNGKDL